MEEHTGAPPAIAINAENHMTRTITRALRSVVLGVLVGSMACAGGPPPAAMAPPPAMGPASLGPGDKIGVFIWQEPELSGEFLVAPNGMVVFPLLGVREVVGISPEEVEARLTADYAEFLENPSVNVTALRRIAILGEVRLPSLYWVDAPVAHPEMTRYFMTIPEAVRLVLQASLVSDVEGQVAMLEMGEPVLIVDLAKMMLRLAGKPATLGRDIVFTGLRPGEKFHKELVALEEETVPTDTPEVHLVLSNGRISPSVLDTVEQLERGPGGPVAAVLDQFLPW